MPDIFMITVWRKVMWFSPASSLLLVFLIITPAFSGEYPATYQATSDTAVSSHDVKADIPTTTGINSPERTQISPEHIASFQEELKWLQEESAVSIATKHESPVSKAPGIVTVITADEIRNAGFRTLTDVLRMVPGFEIIKMGNIGNTTAGVRGAFGGNKIRIMIDGHFINIPSDGGAFKILDDLPVVNIRQLEIIRGPGSALYGENAFSAVINIITKNGKDVQGVFLSSGYGSFNTREENLLFGEKQGDVEFSGMVNYRDTDGFNGTIKSDQQTRIDNQLRPFRIAPASQAPGNANDWARQFDTTLKAAYKDVYFEGMYINKNRGPFVGYQFALTDGNNIGNNYVFGEIGYKKTFEELVTLKPRIYYDQHDGSIYGRLLPQGSTLILDVNRDGLYDKRAFYPDGLREEATLSGKVLGTEIPFDYKLFDENLLTLGFEYRLVSQTNITYSANFNPVTLLPLDTMQDFSESYPPTQEATRRIWAIYLQDTWDITDTVGLTLGVRHDQYSDFGGTTNPRAGVTWSFTKDASLKVLYGEAFRAPSFTEMYATNQPALMGNEDLDPETIRTYEIGLSYKYFKRVTSSINYFNNDIKDLIVLRGPPGNQVSARFENYGDARVQGIEAETKIDIVKKNYLFMNYTFQDTEYDSGGDMPFTAKNKGNFGVNVNYWKYINTNLNAFFSGKRTREGDDTRDELPSFTLFNLSVIAKEFCKTMEIQGTVFNLFDKDYRDQGPVVVPDDIPRPGRSYFIGLSYQF